MCNSIILAVLANAVSVTINQTHDIIQESFPRSRVATARIVGGADANIEELPYQVSLQQDGVHECGGSIIDRFWIVTAAHCVNEIKKKRLTIRSGTSFVNSGGTVRQVRKIFQHARFDALTFDYDVAVVKVSPPFTLGTNNEDAIKLPPSRTYRPENGAMGLISGWGTITPSKRVLPVHLQSVQLPVISRRKCQHSYLFLYISKRMICAGYLKGRKDACQGDSGGPLVADGVLVGIVSWGLGCGMPGYLGVYANIAYFLPWITSRINVSEDGEAPLE